MSGFKTELLTKEISDKVDELIGELIYQSDLLGCNVVMPVGFQSDGSSVPRVPIIYEMWGNRAHKGGFLHDYLFRSDSVPVVSWMIANRLFLEAMKAAGHARYIRWPMFWGVCIGSCLCYHKKKVGDRL
jgi:hypothetical protein